jgi:hypothetical protein
MWQGMHGQRAVGVREAGKQDSIGVVCSVGGALTHVALTPYLVRGVDPSPYPRGGKTCQVAKESVALGFPGARGLAPNAIPLPLGEGILWGQTVAAHDGALLGALTHAPLTRFEVRVSVRG